MNPQGEGDTRLFSRRFRQQFIHVLNDALGKYYEGPLGVGRSYPRTNQFWIELHKTLVQELGVPHLAVVYPQYDKHKQLVAFVESVDDGWLYWFLQFFIVYLVEMVEPFSSRFSPNYEETALLRVPHALDKLNRYLEMNDLPYRIVDGKFVDRGRQVAVKQIETPALRMLSGDERFAAAADELQEAVSLLGNPSRADDAIRLASHALESTIDVIAAVLKWSPPPASRQLSALCASVREHKLLGGREAAVLDVHFAKLIESAVGGARNVVPGAGHGAGTGGPADPALAEFVVDVACAAVKLLYTAFGRAEVA